MNKGKEKIKKGLAAVFAETATTLTIQNEQEIPVRNQSSADKNVSKALKNSAANSSSVLLNKAKKQRTTQKQPSYSISAKPESKKKPGEAPDGKEKVTWYIDEWVVNKIKHLAVDLKKRDSSLVAECLQVGLQEIVKKYKNNI